MEQRLYLSEIYSVTTLNKSPNRLKHFAGGKWDENNGSLILMFVKVNHYQQPYV